MNYINYLKKNKYSENTIRTYKNIIMSYKDVLHDIRLIKRKIISYFDMPNTAWTHYNVISAYFKWLKDPRLAKLKELKIPPIPLVYREIFTKEFLYRKTKCLDKKSIVIRFLFETGIRASELKNIISIKSKTIIVSGKGGKVREIFHNNRTTALLEPFTYSTKTLRIWVKDVLGAEFTPHSVRRSHATHMLLNGANPKAVMIQLGHSKIETTYRYLHMSKSKNQKIYDKFF